MTIDPPYSMPKINIYFQDLKEPAQCQLWQAVQEQLLSRCTIEPRQEDESEEAFTQRLHEEVDHYINTHNLAHEFMI